MDKITKTICEIISPKMQEWKIKANLTDTEAMVFYMREFQDQTWVYIANQFYYSERHVQRIYDCARKKILNII